MPWARCPFRYEMGDLAKGVRPFATNASPLLQVNAPITAMRPIRIKPQPNQRVLDGETPAKVWKNRLFAFHRRWNSNSDSVFVRWGTPSAIRSRPSRNGGSAAQFIDQEDWTRCHFRHEMTLSIPDIARSRVCWIDPHGREGQGIHLGWSGRCFARRASLYACSPPADTYGGASYRTNDDAPIGCPALAGRARPRRAVHRERGDRGYECERVARKRLLVYAPARKVHVPVRRDGDRLRPSRGACSHRPQNNRPPGSL
jgi:hypothetical protein